MNEERLLELKDYFISYPDTPYLPNMFSEVIQALERTQQKNKQLKHILDELEKWLEENWQQSQDIWFVKIINKIKELRGRENE